MPGIVQEIDTLTSRMSPSIILGTELRLINDHLSAERRLLGLATGGTDTNGPEVRPASFSRINVARVEASVALRVSRCAVPRRR